MSENLFLKIISSLSVRLSFFHLVPLELPVIKREHFNRWYSARAYFLSLTLADIPIQVFCTVIYILITYFMTSQPLEFARFTGFFFVNLLVCFVAQGLGLLCGSIFNVKYGCIFGNFFITPFLIFSGFFIQLKHAHHLTHWLFHISFLKYALEGKIAWHFCGSTLINTFFQVAFMQSLALTEGKSHVMTMNLITVDTLIQINF